MNKVQLNCVLLFLLCVEISSGFIKLVPVINVVRVKNNPQFVNATSIIHREGKTRTNQSIDWEIEVTRNIKDLRVTVTYYTDSAAQNALLTRSTDACAFLKRPATDRILKTLWDHMKRDSCLPTRCPIKLGRYYIRNLRPADISIPGFMPETDFILEMMFLHVSRNEPLVESRCYGRLVRIVDDKLF